MSDLESRFNTANHFSAKRLYGIKRAIELGKRLQDEHHDIADKYRSGKTLQEIAAEYEIPAKYHVSGDVATVAVGYALRGHGGNFYEEYAGLIDDKSELNNLRKQHRFTGGRKAHERCVGIFARTSEEHSQDGMKGGIMSTISKGMVPWAEGINGKLSEIEYAYELSKLSEFRRGRIVNYSLIAKKLNEEYHNNNPVRTKDSLYFRLYRFVRSKHLVKKWN